eukprot:SAG31_NODE_140_length_22731_cov_10.941410_20_plen_68_part_00
MACWVVEDPAAWTTDARASDMLAIERLSIKAVIRPGFPSKSVPTKFDGNPRRQVVAGADVPAAAGAH